MGNAHRNTGDRGVHMKVMMEITERQYLLMATALEDYTRIMMGQF